MTNGVVAGGAAASGVAIANAIRAFGAIVSVEPRDFEAILGKAENPLVVCSHGRLFPTHHQYLTAYKGLIFYTKTSAPVPFGPNIETVHARKIWLPA